MIPWTPAARHELQRHASRSQTAVAASGADPAEVLEDLERHITQEAASTGLNVVTEADVRRLLARLGAPSPDPAAETGGPPLSVKTEAPRRPSVWLALGGILLPAITLCVELITGVCGGAFFNPLPTWWHVALVAWVPVANGLALRAVAQGRCAERAWLSWGLGLSVGVGVFYSILFGPMVLPGLLGVVFYGFGLLPLTPLLALICTVLIWSSVRQPPGPARPRAPSGFWPGAVLAWLALVLLDAPTWITRHALSLATSEETHEQQRGLSWLRAVGREETLLRECYGRTRGGEGLDLVGWLAMGGRRVNAEQAREVYYRVTGRPFNSVPAPRVRTARAAFVELDDWSWDQDQGGERVGGRLKGLTLHSSRLDALVEPHAALAYVEWTMEFKNVAPDQREARAHIQLPPGGVVSRLTLWVDGEEREAAFAGRAQTRQAYQQVAIRQRRDPVLVTTSGPDRILMQCFPVPANGGTMRVRIGITTPTPLTGESEGRLAWPAFLERNFTIAGHFRHALWVEGKGDMKPLSPSLHAEQPKPGLVAVRGLVTDTELGSPSTMVRMSRDPSIERVWTPNARSSSGGVVQGTVVATNLVAPTRVILVVDGSADMQPYLETTAQALERFPENLELAILIGTDVPTTLAEPLTRAADEMAALRQRLATWPLRGGHDNLPALVSAWDLAAQKPGSLILWIHAAQPVLLSSPDVLRQAFERRRDGPLLLDCQTVNGPNRILDQLDGVAGLRTLPRQGALVEDLNRQFDFWRGVHREVRLALERLDTPPPTSDQTREVSSHLARLWAAEQVRWLQKSRRTTEAVELAAAYQIVTSVSGAVVLETAQQYVQHDLTPADPTTVPAIPEPGIRTLLLLGLAALWLARRRVQSALAQPPSRG